MTISIAFLKFFHVIAALSLLSMVFYCLTFSVQKKSTLSDNQVSSTFISLNKIILLISVFAFFTGILLIHPKHFTFHTPWIKAAFLLVITSSVIISLLLFMKNRFKTPWVLTVSYLFLLGLLTVTVHDAVTKTTFLL